MIADEGENLWQQPERYQIYLTVNTVNVSPRIH